MAAFSRHREDGDELLGCCFSVAYSHVEERWRGERTGRVLPCEGVVHPPVRLPATPEQKRPVAPASRIELPRLRDLMKQNVFFPMPCRVNGVNLQLQSTPPLSAPPPCQTTGTPDRPGKPLPNAGRRNALPSAPSNLLLIVCILTFIGNSFHWHLRHKSWEDEAREGIEKEDGEEGRRKGKEGYPFSLLVIASHPVKLPRRTPI